MKQEEFMALVRAFAEMKDAVKELGELQKVLVRLDEVKTILSQNEKVKNLNKLVEFIETECWMMKDYFTIIETACYLNVSKSLIYNLLKNNVIPSYKIGNDVLIKKEDIVTWIESHRRQSQEEISLEAQRKLDDLKFERRMSKVGRSVRRRNNEK